MTVPLVAKPKVWCSFCGKSEHDVELLIAGPRGIFICSEDVILCVDIVSENRAKHAAAARGEPASSAGGASA